MKKIFPYKSLTKNWPGGRRKAVVLSAISHGGSAMLWRPIDYVEPEPSQGGMALTVATTTTQTPEPLSTNDGHLSSLIEV